ncbi:MAG: GNAT family N-acetyltransferase [Streptosporangiaceae bacterium]
MAPEIRLAFPAGVPALEQVAAAAYEIYRPRIGRAPAPVTADYAGAVSRGEVWAATDEGAVVGLLVLVPESDHLLLENVAVVPSQQRSGIGTRLLELAEEQAARRGLSEIRLYTNVAMTENIAYYARHGYAGTHRGSEEGFERAYFRKQLPGLAALP